MIKVESICLTSSCGEMKMFLISSSPLRNAVLASRLPCQDPSRTHDPFLINKLGDQAMIEAPTPLPF